MDETRTIPGVSSDIATSARAYGWVLGGKDNYEVDRQFMARQLSMFPAGLDIMRQNRQFLYRAVRFLAAEAGVRQFIDMGCGLPTNDNVHQVAARFVDDARVVYVDNDPIVLAHGRVLLANNPNTSVITADMRDQEAVRGHEDVQRLIDFSEPLAVLFLSVGHHLPDAFDPRAIVHGIIDAAAPGSHVAFSQVVCDDPERGAMLTEGITRAGIPWQTRTPAEVDALLSGFDPVEPGLVNLADWRPDPDQPPLQPTPPELKQYEGASRTDRSIYEYGGVLARRG